MEYIHPDLGWYEAIGTNKGVVLRCPYATVRRCPRYYQSLSLVGEAGISTKIAKEEDEKLLTYWKTKDIWPTIGEQTTSISGGSVPNCFSNFCPEVSFLIFGFFASEIIRYFDSIDKSRAFAKLEKEENIRDDDWRRRYQHLSPLHYTQCCLYSLLLQPLPDDKDESTTEEVLELKPGMWGIRLDVKGLITRLAVKSQGNSPPPGPP
ncbi:MAG: hypothetical protein ABSC19_11840 [Syntrophorhabdales bacterium]